MTISVSFPLKTQKNSSGVPEWIHLLPAGKFPAVSGGKIFNNNMPEILIAKSMATGKIVLDENHATDLVASKGASAPACGWIVDMEVRSGDQGGIWGKVDWTKYGRKLMEDRAYRFVSPVLKTIGGDVVLILRAALTNNPDLTLTSLHAKGASAPAGGGSSPEPIGEKMELKELAKMLGLPENSSKEVILQCLEKCLAKKSMHSEVAALAGLNESAEGKDVLKALKGKLEEVSLHSKSAQEIAENYQKQISDLQNEIKTDKAKAFVKEQGRSKLISEEAAKELITLHCSNPAMAENLVKSFPDAPSGSQITLHGGAPAINAGEIDTAVEKALNEAFELSDEDCKKYGGGR